MFQEFGTQFLSANSDQCSVSTDLEGWGGTWLQYPKNADLKWPVARLRILQKLFLQEKPPYDPVLPYRLLNEARTMYLFLFPRVSCFFLRPTVFVMHEFSLLEYGEFFICIYSKNTPTPTIQPYTYRAVLLADSLLGF